MAKTTSDSSPETEHRSQRQACPACGSYDGEDAFEGPEAGFTLRVCSGCGLGRTLPPLSADRVEKYYPETYYGRENVRFNVVFELLTRLFRRRRANVIRSRTRPGPILDVGCGRGFILARLRELGYDAHGIELSNTAAWHARNVLGLDIETCDFLESPHRKGIYNAVILWHSLEHMPRPVEAISRARELLTEGGLLAIAVPNIESLQARLFGRHWFHLDIPRHYFHFGAASLTAVLARHGFDVIKEDHFCLEQNPYGWIQSTYNALGFDDNFLYALLKNRSARTTRMRRHPVQVAATIATLPLVALAGMALTTLEALLRRGGTIECYAVKRAA